VPVFASNKKMKRSLVAIGISERLADKEISKIAKALTSIRDDVEETQI
jgi:hypothetical protein